MSVSEFTISLYEEMEISLTETGASAGSDLQKFRLSSRVILNAISKLKAFVQNYKFTAKEEEINFFKHLKPKFYSKLIYHQKLARIQSHNPISALLDSRSYYLNELRKINDYLNDNYEFVTYYRSQATSMDEMYFLRKEPDSWLLMNFEEYETDLSFSTIYDHKISKIIAYESLSEFINSTLAKLEIRHDLSGGQKSLTQTSINWTGSKVSLVELLYALQSAGSCNNGTIDLKQLASHFEALFNIDPEKEKALIQSLQKGNIQSVSVEKGGVIQKMFIEANPQFKSVNLYDGQMKRVMKEGLDQYKAVGHEQGKDAKQEQKKDVKEDIKKAPSQKAGDLNNSKKKDDQEGDVGLK